MKVNEKMINSMDEVKKYGLMAQNIKVNILMDKKMVKEY